jgi:hypothetical protein
LTRSDVNKSVSRLIEDPGLRDTIAAKAQRDIAARHSDWTASCERIYEIISGRVDEGRKADEQNQSSRKANVYS